MFEKHKKLLVNRDAFTDMVEEYGKKKKPIIRLLLAGMIIVSVCMLVCVFLVNVLRDTYSGKVSEALFQKDSIFGAVVDNEIQTKINFVKKTASMLQDTKLDDDSIKSLLQVYDNNDENMELLYISANNTIYKGEDKISERVAKSRYKGLLEYLSSHKGFNCILGDYADNSTDNSQLLIISPLTNSNKEAGNIACIVDISSMLSATDNLQTGNTEYYLINRSFTVLTKSSTTCIAKESQVDFADCLNEFSDKKSKSDNNIMFFKTAINRNQDGYFRFYSFDAKDIQVSFYGMDSISDTYYIVCHTDNQVENIMQPLIFKCVLSCITMMVLMIAIIIYVWASAKKSSITIEKLAYEDPVTKGKNINYFKDFANDVMNIFKETPFVIYRFDIANFRYINESYGHIRANEVLSSCIKNFYEVFSSKELCVRMDSDQFLAIVVNDKLVDSRLAQYLKAINLDARSRGIKYPIKLKIGVYQIKKHERDIDVMIDHANAARRTLTGTEKQTVVYYTEKIVTDMRKVDRIESDMQRALATGEFQVYYQPKWDIVSDHVAGAEALVRWIKNDGTVIYPDTFIPIFEKNGFIEKLDFYVLEAVCSQMREMLDQEKTVYPISVNQSRVLLHSPDYVENVEKIIKKYNIPANAIELEITETVLQDEHEDMMNIIFRLKECGVRLSMDDFGSGYSSLNMLKNVKFDIIKIDREFFSESVTSEESMWILQKIIEMVNGLGMEIICEGVETGEQSALLRSIGCRMVQGYFYSKPVPAEEYIERFC